MRAASILIVEDNPIARKMFRLALVAAGFRVRDAENGHSALELIEREAPDLVLLDLHLPDIDGVDLARQLRLSPQGASLPIVAVSGFLSRIEQAQTVALGFSDYLFKPVEPSRLVDRVRNLLASTSVPSRVGNGQVVLAVDDDPVELKLLRIRLETLGFRVITAGDGLEAQRVLHQSSPQVVVSDVLMPRMDGFTLCQVIRRDPGFAALPIVLLSSAYVDEADQALAMAAGASAYLTNSTGLDSLGDAIINAIGNPVPSSSAQTADLPIDAYLERAIQQLGRQVQLNHLLTQRVALLEGELTIVEGLARMLAQERTLEAFLEQTLSRSLNVVGLSAGAIYLAHAPGQLSLQTQLGYDAGTRDDLAKCFGCTEFFLEAITGNEPLVLRSSGALEESSARILKNWRARSMLIAPLVITNERLGLLVIVSTQSAIEPDVIQFVRICSHHAAHAIYFARASKERRRSDERYRTLAESSKDAIFIVDREGYLEYINTAGAEACGMPAERITGMHLKQLCPESIATNFAANVAEVVSSGKSVREQERIILQNSERWVDIRLVPLRTGEAGHVQAILGTARDITDLKTLEAQFQQSQKLEAVGQLAGGIAHDFNNLLTAIIGYSSLLVDALPDDDHRRADLEEIHKAGERGAGLTRQLLAFSRRQIVNPTLLSLNEVLTNLEPMLRRLIEEHVDVRMRLDPMLSPVRADAGQMEQIVMNLALNARDAMPKGGALTLDTANVVLAEHDTRMDATMAPGRYVKVAVRDTGVGMDQHVRDHLFEPFFTTKEKGKGTGLGLATVYGIVKQSGGSIKVSSEPGQGAVFEIYLPCAEGIVEPVRDDTTARLPRRGSETILLVEDDTGVRTFARKVLERYGYFVLEADNGAEALSIRAGVKSRIDLVLTDVVMPGMDGPALIEKLSRQWPDLKVIYTSGYADSALVRDILQPGTAFLQKPFTGGDLARKIGDVLASVPQTR